MKRPISLENDGPKEEEMRILVKENISLATSTSSSAK